MLSYSKIPTHEYVQRDPILFGDFRNAVNEGEPRFYEDLLDYEAIYFLFQEVKNLEQALCEANFSLKISKTPFFFRFSKNLMNVIQNWTLYYLKIV